MGPFSVARDAPYVHAVLDFVSFCVNVTDKGSV